MNYYQILQIEPGASLRDIKKAYRRLALQYHPDKNKSPDAENKFREISEAYDILMNTDKRRMYDNFGYDSISGDIPEINPLASILVGSAPGLFACFTFTFKPKAET